LGDDAPDPNAGKSAEERGAARARRKGKNVDERKPRDGAGAGGGVAEDPTSDDAADDALAEPLPVDAEAAFGGRGELGDETVVALKSLVEDVSLADARETASAEEPELCLSPEDVEAARAEASAALSAWRERAAGGAGNDAAAQALWSRLELLTGSLSGELAEQLRLILEPTLASRLTGDFRTGKRLNMRKIIPYIASDFRKDKIWLRRSKPSQRKYQVVLAIDDSKSMTENACGHLALESMALIARAMARLEVGEIGVVSFGAGGSTTSDGDAAVNDASAVRTLHPLGAPFTDQGGPALVSQFTFAQDNTLADQPVVGLLTHLDASLEAARDSSRGGSETLQQLCLIIADGRFHEKEALRRQMREMSQKRGLLVAFIVLDNPKSSVLDMQTVSFANGKPEFAKYLDTFPFPFYTLVQDIAKLPAVISDLLRQWFEITAGG
jgi:midasin